MARPKGGKNQVRTCYEKAKLVEEYFDSGIGYKRFAQEKGISPSLFSTWIKKYQNGGVEALRLARKPGNPADDAKDAEILNLKLIIAEQQVLIEDLKKQLL